MNGRKYRASLFNPTPDRHLVRGSTAGGSSLPAAAAAAAVPPAAAAPQQPPSTMSEVMSKLWLGFPRLQRCTAFTYGSGNLVLYLARRLRGCDCCTTHLIDWVVLPGECSVRNACIFMLLTSIFICEILTALQIATWLRSTQPVTMEQMAALRSAAAHHRSPHRIRVNITR